MFIHKFVKKLNRQYTACDCLYFYLSVNMHSGSESFPPEEDEIGVRRLQSVVCGQFISGGQPIQSFHSTYSRHSV